MPKIGTVRARFEDGTVSACIKLEGKITDTEEQLIYIEYQEKTSGHIPVVIAKPI